MVLQNYLCILLLAISGSKLPFEVIWTNQTEFTSLEKWNKLSNAGTTFLLNEQMVEESN